MIMLLKQEFEKRVRSDLLIEYYKGGICMKGFAVLLLVPLLLLTLAAPALADVFSINTELSASTVKISGPTSGLPINYGIDDSLSAYYIDMNLNLYLIRFGLEFSFAQPDDEYFSTIAFRAGWEKEFGDVRAKLFLCYLGTIFGDGTNDLAYGFSSYGIGFGADWQATKHITLSAFAVFPVSERFYFEGDLYDDSDVSMGYFKVGFRYRPFKIVEYSLNYRMQSAEYEPNDLKMSIRGFAAGINFNW
jgi:hypothetical protein